LGPGFAEVVLFVGLGLEHGHGAAVVDLGLLVLLLFAVVDADGEVDDDIGVEGWVRGGGVVGEVLDAVAEADAEGLLGVGDEEEFEAAEAGVGVAGGDEGDVGVGGAFADEVVTGGDGALGEGGDVGPGVGGGDWGGAGDGDLFCGEDRGDGGAGGAGGEDVADDEE
jgi:hypothetical protein